VSQNISIENRDKKFTSRKAAVSFVERGIAAWTSEAHTAIRFLEPEEQFLARAERQDEHYWREIAAQRGGGHDVAFHWQRSISNGYDVMGATPVAIPKGAQVSHVGPEK
jgi:hypothetical protein